MKKFVRIAAAFLGLLALAEIVDLVYLSAVRATITTAASSVTIAGNGSSTSFFFSFVGGSPSYIVVTYTDTNGNQTVLPTSQYTLTLNPAPPGQVWGIGGNVVYPTVASGNPPIAALTSLTISRSVPLTQAISSNQGQAFPTVVEAALDILEMEIQQIGNLSARIVVGPITDPPGLNYVLPSVTQRAGQILCFDGSGNVTTCTVAPSGAISSVMAPVVSASTLALARSAFGLGSMAVENINSGTLGGPSLQDDGAGNARVGLPATQDSISQTVTCNYHLTQHIATGPITYTLPRANTCFNGFGFWIYSLANGGAITLTPNSNDNFVNVGSGTPVVILSSGWTYISTNAQSSGTWYMRSTFASPAVTVPVRTAISTTDPINAVTDYFICPDNGSAPALEQLPAGPWKGLSFLIKDCGIAAATHNISVIGLGGVNIDGTATYVINANGGSAAFTFTGSMWSIN